MDFTRFAIYYTPPPGAFADAGAAWLGWDVARGRRTVAPAPELSERPRKYGFHATVKAPFGLADGVTQSDLEHGLEEFCAAHQAVDLEGLEISSLGSFLALTGLGDDTAMKTLAAQCVSELDSYRAALTSGERARKTRPDMRPELRENLERWGYPYVNDAYRFHMTLTGPLKTPQRTAALSSVQSHFAEVLPSPFTLDALTLVGEADAGMFYEIGRVRLRQML